MIKTSTGWTRNGSFHTRTINGTAYTISRALVYHKPKAGMWFAYASADLLGQFVTLGEAQVYCLTHAQQERKP
jgi:hypothetical protein